MSKEATFDELRHGKTYKKTRAKHGKKTAQRQMVAIALKHEREKKKGKKRHHSRAKR
jgi:hypothetical protein